MIARPLPYDEIAPRPRGTRSGRTAAHVRRKRTKAKRYAGFVQIFSTVGVITIAVVVYLALMANVTRMNYELAKSDRTKSALVDENSRLDDRIARLETRERLARLANSLGYREPDTFATVVVPEDRVATVPHGSALLSWLR